MNARYGKRKRFFSLLGMGAATIAIVMLLSLLGCPVESEFRWRPPATGGSVAPPATPVITSMESSFAFAASVMNNLADTAAIAAAMDLHKAGEPGGTEPTIAFTWTGANTEYFNIYFSEWPVKPPFPQITGVRDNVYFIREGLEPNTEYFVWVEAVNANGSVLSAPWNVTTKNRGGVGLNNAGNTLERGDYPRPGNLNIEAGDGQLTVWWSLADRVGWSEVYVARVRDRGTAWDYSGDAAFDGPDPVGPMVRYGVRAVNVWQGSQFPNTGPWAGRSYGADAVIWPQLVVPAQGWTGYYFARVDGVHGDTRPMIGTASFGASRQTTDPVTGKGVAGQLGRPLFHPAGAFPFVMEAWWEGDDPNSLGRLVPYQPISVFPQFLADDVFPWDDVNGRMGTPGQPVAHFRNHATITGLENGVEYEVWIRVPNVWGERGFAVVRGTPGASDLPAPTGIIATVPQGTTRELSVAWNSVSGATAYRLYYSPFNETPGPRSSFQRVPSTGDGRHTATIIGLLPDTQYFIWVAAERDGIAGRLSSAVWGRTGLPTVGQMRPRLDVNGHRVRTLLYVEVNDNNILNAGDYVLEDGTFLWDYVVIFAANLRRRNCNECPDHSLHGCTENGIHVHFNENVRHILNNRSTFIQPLQDKGIRVILGLLGDWDGVGFGTMSQEEIDTLVAHIAQVMEVYQLDGVDFDDEWANDMRFGNFGNDAAWNASPDGRASATAVYPFHAFGWPFSVNVWRNPTMGVEAGNIVTTSPGADFINPMWLQSGRNFFHTMRATREAFNELEARLPPMTQDIAQGHTGRSLTITLYEFNTGRWITPASVGGENTGYTLTNFLDGRQTSGGTPGEAMVDTITVADLAAIVDMSLQPWYNQWISNSANLLPSRLYSPLAIDVSGHAYDGQNNSPNPPFPGRGTLTIQTVADRFRAASDFAAGLGPGESQFVAQNSAFIPHDGGYFGVMFFYNLRPASMLLSETPGGPAIRTVEEYLSYLTMTVFGQRTVLTAGGGDRPKGF